VLGNSASGCLLEYRSTTGSDLSIYFGGVSTHRNWMQLAYHWKWSLYRSRGLLLSARKDSPRLVIINYEDRSLQGVIAADTINLDCPPSIHLFDFILNLHAAYYACDLEYPTAYQLLAFMQAHVPQDEKESVFKCSALVKMEKALKLETRGAQGCYSTVTM